MTADLSFGVAGGTIDGGTVETTGGAALFATHSGGTLDGVTLDGTLDLTGYYPSLDVTGGLTLDNGTIDIGNPVASNSYRHAHIPGRTDPGRLRLGRLWRAAANRIDTESSGGDSGTLTIGPNVTVGGDYGYIGFNDNNSNIETPIVIQGTVDATTSGGAIVIYSVNGSNSGTIEATGGAVILPGTNWTNSGTIQATDGGSVTVDDTWTNSGTIAATTGGIAYLEGSFTDPGVISVDSTSQIYLDGTFSVDSGSSFAGTGVDYLRGTLDNTGETLTLDDPGLTFALYGGTIDGGTVETTGGAALVATGVSGTLDGVTIDGTLDMSTGGDTVTVTDGLTLNGTLDLGPADPANGASTLDFQGAQTLGGTGLIVLGGAGY